MLPSILERPAGLRRVIVLAAIAFGAGLAILLAVGGIPHRTEAAAENPVVRIEDYQFSPGTITIPVGGSVVWINKDQIPHTIVSADNPRAFRSDGLDTDDKFTFTFTKAGTYTYFCSVHPYMTGKIVVR